MTDKKAYMKAYYREHKSEHKDNNLRHAHGITLLDYNRLFAEQQGLCLGCKRHQSQFKQSLVVDHNHRTEKIRGLLCNQCNTALGLVKDNTETLLRLVDYLQKK